MNPRISRADMFSAIISTIAKRSTCNRAEVGALIAFEGRILSMGYAGSPAGLAHCHDAGCLIGSDGGCQRTIHAEANAIAFAARHGIAIDGSDLWCSYTPCLPCAKLIVNSGIRHVFALQAYRDTAGLGLLMEAGIPVTVL